MNNPKSSGSLFALLCSEKENSFCQAGLLVYYEITRLMDGILDTISKHNSQRLKEVLSTRVTQKESSILDLTIKDVEELFVFACYTGSSDCLLVLSKFGKLKKKNKLLAKLVNSPYSKNMY